MEKEKKTIKCSYAVLVIILFAALAFVTDYAIIERKMNKCNCPKCGVVTNNGEKEDNTTVDDNNETQKENNMDVEILSNADESMLYVLPCVEKGNGSCIIKNANAEIVLKYVKYGLEESKKTISFNGKNSNLSFYTIDNLILLPDNCILIKYDIYYYAILDTKGNIVTDFNTFTEGEYLPLGVTYEDDVIYVMKTNYNDGVLSACKSGISEDTIIRKYYTYEYAGNGKLGNLLKKTDVSLRDLLKSDEQLNSCPE